MFGLLAGFGSSPAAEAAAQDGPIILLERNSEWKYFDQGQDLNSVWRATYDDSLWDSGFAPFGYKDNGSGIAISTFGPLNTEVDYGPDKKLKHRTTYFRTNLQINKEEIDGYGQLLGTFGIDDGAVIYVNGHEVRRFGMPEGEITYSTGYSGLGDAVYCGRGRCRTCRRVGNNRFAPQQVATRAEAVTLVVEYVK